MSDDRLKIYLGFTIAMTFVIGIMILSGLIGLGTVKPETSFGLETLLESLKLMGAAWMGAMALAWWNGRQDKQESKQQAQSQL